MRVFIIIVFLALAMSSALMVSCSFQVMPTATIVSTAETSSVNRAIEIAATMSLNEKIGQLFLVCCPVQDAALTVSQYQFGGYILFADDFKDKTILEVTANIQSYQANAKIPMLIGVDEEGGTVNRISLFANFRSEPFHSPQELYSAGGWDLVVSDTVEKADLLKTLGINLNLAPVCDVPTSSNDYIYPRSFGFDAALTANYVKTVVEIMNSEKIASVLKHFPGYGSNLNTHNSNSIDLREYSVLASRDFLPFIAGISANAAAILGSHNIVTCIDTEYPASLSPKVVDVLRNELGFDGVIMTDDLDMGAVKNMFNGNDIAVMAILAGNDMICCREFTQHITALYNAVTNGVLSESRINESVIRILNWKLSLGMIA